VLPVNCKQGRGEFETNYRVNIHRHIIV
jgi:hypothetical protein